jgi:predicted ArsR family transcriptional regulator
MDMTTIRPGPEQLKALTHPVRVRMLMLLRLEGPATATTLAARLGLNTGATSYHLRQLAQHGFVVDDAERGNGRDRWWKAAHQSTRTPPVAPDDDASQETLDAYLQAVAVVMAENVQRAIEERPYVGPEWHEASTISDWHFRLTPAQARELLERVVDPIEAAEDTDDEGAADWAIQIAAFPQPGHITVEEQS